MGEYNDILALEKDEDDMPDYSPFRRREYLQDINKIKKLDLQKGDVILITIDDSNPKNLPRSLLSKLMKKQCDIVRGAFKEIFKDKVQLIFIPKSMDISVIRLEEWFV